jgi:hypothetical protein
MTAESGVKSAPTAPASRRASDVSRVPGGPQRRSDARWPRETDRGLRLRTATTFER